MAARPQPQLSLSLGLAAPNPSLPQSTEAELIAALAELIVQRCEMNETIATPSEETIDE